MKKLLLVFLLIFSIIRTSSETLTVAWEPNPEETVVGYSIYYKKASDINYISMSIAGRLNTNAPFVAAPYTLYQIYITALDGNGLESEGSDELRAEVVYVNAKDKATSLNLLDVNAANFSQFVLISPLINGVINGTLPNITYTATNTSRKDMLVYKSPEIVRGMNVTNFYAIYKVLSNRAPTIFQSP